MTMFFQFCGQQSTEDDGVVFFENNPRDDNVFSSRAVGVCGVSVWGINNLSLGILFFAFFVIKCNGYGRKEF